MATQAQFSVTLSKTAQNSRAARDYGTWAGKTGGESTRDVTDYYPGAMKPAIKETATPTTSDITVRKREADLTDADIRELYIDLESDAVYACVIQRLSAADHPSGAPRSYRCIVSGIAPNDVGGDSSDIAELEVTLSVFGMPTIAA
jgi:hypothetical protein